MNIFSTVLGSVKGLALSVIEPIVSAADPAAGKLISDGAAAFSDSKLTLEEAEQIALDGVDLAAEKLPKFAAAFEALKVNIREDIPELAGKIIPHLEDTVKAFEECAKA